MAFSGGLRAQTFDLLGGIGPAAGFIACPQYVGVKSRSGIIRRKRAAKSGADCASPDPRARTYRNIPSTEADDPLPEEVMVQDPRHPLCGRCFAVLRRVSRRAGNVLPSFEVGHVGGTTLLISQAACKPRPVGESHVKLSVAGLRELVSLAGSLDTHADRPGRGMGHTPDGPAAADRRGRRRGSGGDAS